MKAAHIWLSGALVPWEQATIHVTTHTLHYGSGAFEGIRCYPTPHGPAIFRLSEHVTRLLHSFSCFEVPFPWTHQEIERAIIDTVNANGLSACYIRPLIFFAGESLLLSPKKLAIHCAIITIPMEKYLGTKAIKVAISRIRRIDARSLPVHNKINGLYINSILALHEAQNRGFNEALLLDCDGMVAEGSVANIFFVIDGILTTPPTTAILPGITRASILAIAQKFGIPTQERPITVEDIKRATEAFFTGTASEITPIGSIEEQTLLMSPHSLTATLKDAYNAITAGNDHAFASWLTPLTHH